MENRWTLVPKDAPEGDPELPAVSGLGLIGDKENNPFAAKNTDSDVEGNPWEKNINGDTAHERIPGGGDPSVPIEYVPPAMPGRSAMLARADARNEYKRVLELMERQPVLRESFAAQAEILKEDYGKALVSAENFLEEELKKDIPEIRVRTNLEAQLESVRTELHALEEETTLSQASNGDDFQKAA